MKYVLVIGDGMADFPVEELSGKTPLQAAKKPVIDRLAGQGLVGEVRTVPRGVYLAALVRICSSTKENHFLSVRTVPGRELICSVVLF